MDRILSVFVFSIILLYGANPACSQNGYIVHHYTNENGLPANGIKGIELDKKTGYLWIGTQAGLVRFDGINFKDFRSAKNKVAASRITFIAQNREGVLYCEDDNSSVYQIAQNQPQWAMTDTFFQPFIYRAGSFPTKPPTQLVENLKRLPRTSFLPNWVVFHDEQGDSSSFTFHYLGNACHYSAAKDSLLYFPDEHNVQNILKLDGSVYFVRENLELWEYNDSLMKLLPVKVKGMPDWSEQGERPRFVWQPGMKEPLLVYKKDIWKLHKAGNTLYLETLCQDCCPEDQSINVAQIWEEQGIIFLGSVVKGLYVVKSPFLRRISTDTVYKNKTGRAEYALAEIIPGSITTSSGYTFSLNGGSLPRKTVIEFHRYSIYQNQEGDWWFHVKDTIIHFKPKTGQYKKIAVNDGAVKMMFVQTRNKLYVVSDIAIAEITDDQYHLLYEPPPAAHALKNSLNPDGVIEWKPGIIAIAGEKLVLFDTGKSSAPDTIPIPGLTTKLRSLMKYRDYLLISTYGQGFYMYRNGVVKKMPLDKNQYLSYPHCFLQDDNGFCWISTNHGLFKVSLNALVTAFENDLDEIYYQYFGKDDGILNTEFNGGCQPCALKLSNGLYSFPTMNGIALFDPLGQQAPPPSGRIFIDEVWADTTQYGNNDKSFYKFPHDIRNLRFSLSLPQFGNRENIYFSYKLEPYNDQWETQDIVQNNKLQFGGLKPGKYKLYLRVRNGFEPSQFVMKVIEFRILKPWFQTWWFYMLCLLGLIAVTWGLIKWRMARLIRRKKELQQMVAEKTRSIAVQSRQLEGQLDQLKSQQIRLEEDNRIKARLIAIISHDMLGPLKFMGFMSRKMRDDFSPSDPAYRTVDSMATVTQELESLSVNMLNWIRFHYETDKMKPERFDLSELINESTEIASTLAKDKGIKLFNDITEATYIWQYRQALGVIIYNLAMNAVNYTETGEIRISGQVSNDHFTLLVSDTGKGMSMELVNLLNSEGSSIPDYSPGEIKKFQFGYRIIKDLLQVIHGKLRIDSKLNQGTQIAVEFLAGQGSNYNKE